MGEKIWNKDTIGIKYMGPVITAHRRREIESIESAMYFYYDISVEDGEEVLFKSSIYDFPKVQDLSKYIEYMIDMKEDEMFLYEDYEHDDYKRKKLYNFIELNDSFSMDMEYFYKIEKTVAYVKKPGESEFKRYEEYALTIGQHARNKNGYSDGEDFGKSVFIKYLEKEDIMRLKDTAEEFCKMAVEEYNDELRAYKIKCPECGVHQLYLSAKVSTEEDEYMDYYKFECVECSHEFDDDDDYHID